MVDAGALVCACGRAASIQQGIPSFVIEGAVTGTGAQVVDSFSFKWQRLPGFGFDHPVLERFYDDWFARKLGLTDADALARMLGTKQTFLDAGTGLGAKLGTYGRANPTGLAVGVDISASVVPAADNTRPWRNTHIIRADVFHLPLRRSVFDLIVSDGVLHHTPDPRKAFEALVPYLAPGGHIAIHVYRRQGPIREFCDDHLRAQTTRLTPEACWAFSESMTRIGQALARPGTTVDLPSVPELGIAAGPQDIQRFVYQHVMKCFWNPEFTFDENVLVNFDWYHPAHASRHTEDEVRAWFIDSGLVDIEAPKANENGVSMIGRRAG
jgi:SAM-dependent methyltransferase